MLPKYFYPLKVIQNLKGSAVETIFTGEEEVFERSCSMHQQWTICDILPVANNCFVHLPIVITRDTIYNEKQNCACFSFLLFN